MKKKPLVSLANLVEFATTPSAARRRAIIEQYHQPDVTKFDWHGASDAIFIQRALGSTEADSLIDLERSRIEALLNFEANKERIRRLRHILHLVELLETSDVLRLTEGTEPQSAKQLASDYVLGELTVRVRPHLILSKEKPGRRNPQLGVLRCHNLSTFKLGTAGPMFAVGLNLFAEATLGIEDTTAELCCAYDLFEDRPHFAPKNQKKLRGQLFDAAQEIVDRWDAIGRRVAESTSRKRKAS